MTKAQCGGVNSSTLEAAAALCYQTFQHNACGSTLKAATLTSAGPQPAAKLNSDTDIESTR